jgi:hypothetical protein
MDQAPVQNVDVVRSLETTLGVLTHILNLESRCSVLTNRSPLLTLWALN